MLELMQHAPAIEDPLSKLPMRTWMEHPQGADRGATNAQTAVSQAAPGGLQRPAGAAGRMPPAVWSTEPSQGAQRELSPLRGSVAAQLAEAPDQLVAGSLSSGAASKIRKARETQKSLPLNDVNIF